METTLDKMCDWERKKGIFLMSIAEDLGMNTSGYGQLAVNPNSGYTYLWLEDYPFTLFMPISCELKKSDVSALWSNPEDGTEWGMDLSEDTNLDNLYKFVENCENGKTDEYDQY